MRHHHSHIKNKIRHLRPKRSLFTRPIFWLCILLLILSGGVFYLFFFFPKFQVQEVIVSGNEKTSSQNIEALVWQDINKKALGISHKSIFTVDANKIKKDILVELTGIKEVKVQKQWLQNIKIEVIERSPVAIFCPNNSNQNCFFIDDSGVIYESIDADKNQLIVRQVVADADLVAGRVVVDKSILDAIMRVKSDLKNNFQIDIVEVFSSNPLIFTTQEQWEIYVDPTLDIGAQITKLDLLLKNSITSAVRKNLKYIYLQYKDRAYYK